MNSSRWIVAGALACLAAACGGGGGGSTAGTGGAGTGGESAITKEQACEQLATVQCDGLERCAPYGLTTDYAGDKAQCVSRNKSACLGSLGLTGVTVTPAALAACADAKKTLACPGYFDPAPPTACDFRGSKENGSACALGMECKSGVCLSTGASGCGVCVAQPAVGDSCDPKSGCGSLACAPDGGCIKYALLGAYCSDNDSPCNPMYYCDSDTYACKELLAAGADCSSGFCDWNKSLHCDTTADTCVDRPQIDQAGADCLGAACKGMYCNGLYQCTAWTTEGGDCDNGPLCQPPATCQSGKCRLEPATCQ